MLRRRNTVIAGSERNDSYADSAARGAKIRHRKVVSQYTTTNPFINFIAETEHLQQQYQAKNDAVCGTTAPHYSNPFQATAGSSQNDVFLFDQRIPEEAPAPQMYIHSTAATISTPLTASPMTAATTYPSFPMSLSDHYDKISSQSLRKPAPDTQTQSDEEGIPVTPAQTRNPPISSSVRGHKKRNSFAWSIRRRRSTTPSSIPSEQQLQQQASAPRKPLWTREEFREAIEQKNQRQLPSKQRPHSLYVTTNAAIAAIDGQQDGAWNKYYYPKDGHNDHDHPIDTATVWPRSCLSSPRVAASPKSNNPFLADSCNAPPTILVSGPESASGTARPVTGMPSAAAACGTPCTTRGEGGREGLRTRCNVTDTNPFLQKSSSYVFSEPTSAHDRVTERDGVLRAQEGAPALASPPLRRPTYSLSRSFTDTALQSQLPPPPTSAALSWQLEENSENAPLKSGKRASIQLPATPQMVPNTPSTSSSPSTHPPKHHQRRASLSIVSTFKKTLSRTKTSYRRRSLTTATSTASPKETATTPMTCEEEESPISIGQNQFEIANTTTTPTPSPLTLRGQRVHEEQERLIALICQQREQQRHRQLYHQRRRSDAAGGTSALSSFSSAATNPWSYAHEFSETYRRGESFYDQYGHMRGTVRDARKRGTKLAPISSDGQTIGPLRRRRSRTEPATMVAANSLCEKMPPSLAFSLSSSSPPMHAGCSHALEGEVAEEIHHPHCDAHPYQANLIPGVSSTQNYDAHHGNRVDHERTSWPASGEGGGSGSHYDNSSGSDRSLYSPRAYRVRGTNLWIASGPRGRTGSEIGAGYRQHLLEAATVSEKASLDESQHSSDRNAAAMDEAGEENEESNLKNLTLTLPPEVATEPSTPTAKCPEKHHSRQPSSSFWMDINRRAYGEEQLDELDELHLSHHSEEDTTADENDLPYDPRIFAGGAGTWLGPPSPATPTTLDHPDVAMTSSSGDVHTATLATDNGAPAITGASGGSVSSQELDMDWTARISSRRRSSYSSLSQGFSRRSRKLWHQISASYSAAMVASPEETEEEEEDDREGGLLVNLSGKDDEASYSISSPPSSSLLRPPRSSRKKASGLSEATVIFRPLTTRIRPSPLRHQQQDSLDEKEGQVTRDRATSEDNSTGGCDSTAREATLVGGMASCSSDNDSNEKDESVDPFYYYYYDEFNNSNINRGINNKVYRGRMGRSYGSYNQLNFDSRIEDNGMSGKESSRWTLNILEEKARIQLAKVWHKVGHMVSPRSKHSAVFRSTSTRQEVDEQEAGLPEEMSNEEPWKSHWTLSTSSTSPTLHSHHPHDRPNGPLNSSSSISSYTSSSTSTSARAAGVNHKVKSAVPGIGEGLLRSNTRASRSTTLPSSVRAAVSNLKRQASRRFSVKSEKSTTPEACDWRQQYQHQLQLNPPVMPKTELPPSSTSSRSFHTIHSTSWTEHSMSSSHSINSSNSTSGVHVSSDDQSAQGEGIEGGGEQEEGKSKKHPTGRRRMLKSMKRRLSIVVGHHSVFQATKEAVLSPRSLFSSSPSPSKEGVRHRYQEQSPLFYHRTSAPCSTLSREVVERNAPEQQQGDHAMQQQQQSSDYVHRQQIQTHSPQLLESSDDSQCFATHEYQQPLQPPTGYLHRLGYRNTETVVPHPLAQQSHHGLLYQDDTSNITNYYHDSGQLTSEYKGEQTMDGHSWQGEPWVKTSARTTTSMTAQTSSSSTVAGSTDGVTKTTKTTMPMTSAVPVEGQSSPPTATRWRPPHGFRRQSLRAGNRLMDPSCSIVLEH